MKIHVWQVIFLLFVLNSACVPYPVHKETPGPAESLVRVFLQPVRKGEKELTFSFRQVAAVRSDGARIALATRTDEILRRQLSSGQLLLAQGSLPPGTYKGLLFEIARAAILGEEGEGELQVSPEPTFLPLSFAVAEGIPQAFFLAMDIGASIEQGFRFEPVLNPILPEYDLVGLLGFVAEPQYDVITVFNKTTMEAVALLPGGRSPRGMAVDARESLLYVAGNLSDTIKVIDIFELQVRNTIPLQPGDRPVDVLLVADADGQGKTLLTVNSGSASLSLIDPNTAVERARVRVGNQPRDAVVAPDGRRAFVLNELSQSITVVDMAAGASLGEIPLETVPHSAVMDRFGERLFVTGRNPTLLVIDPLRMEVSDRLNLGMPGGPISLDSFSGELLLGLRTEPTVVLIDPTRMLDKETFWLDGPAFDLAIDQEENAFLALLAEPGRIQKLSLAGRQVIAEMPVPDAGHKLAIFDER